MKTIDRLGQVYGRLTVIERAKSPDGNAKWHCQCSCGRRSFAYGQDLARGKVVSCGCAQVERRFKHGGAHTQVYRLWIQMRRRCYDPNDPAYKNYGARGIRVSEEWQDDFGKFSTDMGPRPPGYWLERKDNEQGYSKENCCWATPKQQQNNRRGNRVIEVDGVKKTMQEWAELAGLSRSTVRSRIERYGWDVKSAVTLPRQAGRALGAQGRYD